MICHLEETLVGCREYFNLPTLFSTADIQFFCLAPAWPARELTATPQALVNISASQLVFSIAGWESRLNKEGKKRKKRKHT